MFAYIFLSCQIHHNNTSAVCVEHSNIHRQSSLQCLQEITRNPRFGALPECHHDEVLPDPGSAFQEHCGCPQAADRREDSRLQRRQFVTRKVRELSVVTRDRRHSGPQFEYRSKL